MYNNSIDDYGLYGITQDPNTKNYALIMPYYISQWWFTESTVLFNSDKNVTCKNRLTWKEKLAHLFSISRCLRLIHNKGYIHRYLHCGNILIHESGLPCFQSKFLQLTLIKLTNYIPIQTVWLKIISYKQNLRLIKYLISFFRKN